MKNPIYATIFSVFTYGCIAVQADTLPKSFSSQYFIGLENPNILDYSRATLDYELDLKKGGVIKFTSCPQAEKTRPTDIVSSQYTLFKILNIDCLALKKYGRAKNSKTSYLPQRLDTSLVPDFPATAVPKMNDEDLKRRTGKTLSDYEKKLKVTKNSDGAVVATTSTDEMQYYLMAKGDFNSDGIQDYAIRVDFRTLNAFGSGSDFFLLTKKSVDAPIEIIWRM